MKTNIAALSKKCKNKKVIFYCISDIFDEISEKLNLKEFFDIIALCDIKFKENKTYKDFCAISPKELKSYEFDYVIILSKNAKEKERFLKENCLLPKKARFLNIKFEEEKINTKENYKKVLKKFKTKEKIRVLFAIEQNQKWCYTNLYKALEGLERFEVLPVILFPVISKGEMIFTQEENKLFFEKLDIKTIDGFDYSNNKNIDIKTLEPDIVFYQQPWYLNNSNHPKFVSSYALTVMAPYGYTTLSEKSWGSESVKEVYRSLWLFLAESPYHVKFYKKAAKMKDNLIPIGSLKLDEYKKPAQNNIWKKPKNPKIIYAPHHSIKNSGLKMSTFDRDYMSFLNFAHDNPQYSFVFKPHPMLENAVWEYGLMDKKDYKNYLQEWDNLENACVYAEGEYFDIFKSSDVLITDCSSFLAEYFPSSHPIIFLNRVDRAPFDKFGKKIQKGLYEAESFFEIEPILKNLFENKIDPLLKTREKILKKEFYIKNSAYKNVIDFLYLKLC